MTHTVAAIVAGGSDRPTLWIRFNPNAFSKGGVTQHMAKKQRYSALLDRIRRPLPVGRHVHVCYMYYDTDENDVLSITRDPEFSDQFSKRFM